jgi:methyl-accepting chemotaxis protein/methyl-accepting chemotaxis protein-1 (serine sensor receptor)
VVVVIRAVSEQAAQVKVLVDEVHMGSSEQARGIQQIAKAIAQIEQVTQKTAANAEESASASQQLSAQAQSMKSVVVELQELVGGGSQTDRRGKARGSIVRGKSGKLPPLASSQKQPAGSLNALRESVARRPPPVTAAVPAGNDKVDRSALPLDDDFKEF